MYANTFRRLDFCDLRVFPQRIQGTAPNHVVKIDSKIKKRTPIDSFIDFPDPRRLAPSGKPQLILHRVYGNLQGGRDGKGGVQSPVRFDCDFGKDVAHKLQIN
jgi:hypothetical protein